eukprot:scaffold15190_cov61-Phaeocystis_antarctica.AAC.1
MLLPGYRPSRPAAWGRAFAKECGGLRLLGEGCSQLHPSWLRTRHAALACLEACAFSLLGIAAEITTEITSEIAPVAGAAPRAPPAPPAPGAAPPPPP